MNKKEVLEIKKLFNIEKNCIDRICGCYVDGNKEKITTFKQAFASLPEEETFKYLSIFRSTLSGTLGKNLINLEFPLDAEEEGGAQEFLLSLRDSELKDDDMLELFYNKIIDNYDYGENYLILLIHATYDVPGKSSDGLDMDDASDYVYSHILCSICPVKLSKEGLCYNTQTNAIETRIRDWIVSAPAHGFLFPAFNDRNSDIHSMVFYAHKADDTQPELVETSFGMSAPMPVKIQKETFSEIITETLGDQCCFETVKNIHETIAAMVEEKKELPEPVELDKTDIQKVFEASGVNNDKMAEFNHAYDDNAGSRTSFMASNIVNTRNFEIKAPDVVVKVASDRTDLIETRDIDGRKYLLIELTDAVEVNGITVRP